MHHSIKIRCKYIFVANRKKLSLHKEINKKVRLLPISE